MNFSETSTFGKMLQDLGVSTAQKGEQADICLINTCSVTEVADKKCRQAIHRLVRENPGAFVVVTGCYAQLEADEVAKSEGVSLVLGSNEKANLVQFLSDAWTGAPTAKYYREKTKDIKSFAPSCSKGNRTRYFLKVQDGCDYFCTYCTIPYARGFSRNPTIASLVAQAQEAAAEGGKEIVLTGVNIGDFGKTTGEKFIDLVKALDGVEGIQRYRISSLEPDLISDELIEYCAKSRAFMPHFHIPLQSGSDEVLRLMHRRYDTKFFAEKIEEVRRYIPEAFVGVDVIVGMRGETDELFDKSRAFMEALPVSQYHVFSYSERPGTKALEIPGIVTPAKKHERSQQILSLSDEKLRTHYNIYKGQTRPVLLEHSRKAGILHGFTDNYIRVEVIGQFHNSTIGQLDNTIVLIRLGEWNEKGDALIGEIVKS